MKVKVIFRKCIQDSQEYGSDDEHMVSRVFFDFQIGDKIYENLYVDVKQTVGSNFESAPLEVGVPQNYKGPFNYSAFREAVEKYYRGLVGKQGVGIHIEGGRNIRMQNNVLLRKEVVEFDVEESQGTW